MLPVIALLAFTFPPAACTSTAALRAYVETAATTAREAMVTARVCLAMPRGARVASISGRVTVDTAFATIVSVDRPNGSPLFARDNGGGVVLFAGAAPRGVRAGTLLTLRARLVRPGALPKIDLQLTELNDASGTSMITRAATAGISARCLGTQSAVFEVLPPEASADPGEPLDLRISGCGFHATKNTVRFGDVTVPNVRSTNGGTRIRIVIPKEYRASGEVPPMQIGPGQYDVSVNNGRGASNARRVTLR